MPVAVAPHVVNAADAVHKAFKGMGTDDTAFIQTVTSLRANELAQLNQAYKAQFGKDIVEAIEKELSGKYKELAIGLVKGSPATEAHALRKAIKGLGTDEKAIANVLAAGRTNADVEAIKAAYKEECNHDLEKDISGDLSGELKQFYVAILQGARDESRSMHQDVNGDVQKLYAAGTGRSGTDETAFVQVLASRSMEHLKLVFNQYAQQHGHSLHHVVKKEFGGKLEYALLTFVDAVENPFIAIAEQLEASMKGLGTDEKELNRVLVRIHHQGWAAAVNQAYQVKFGKLLRERVSGEISGDHKKLALAILGTP